MLFGYPGESGPGIPGIQSNDSFATNPCRNAWKNDPNTSGATVYFGGNSQLTVDGLGAVEISGRERSGQNIAVQALETAPNASTIRGDQRLIRTQSGSNKQLAIQGLVWAPYAALEFDLISNEAVAALDRRRGRERDQCRCIGQHQQLPDSCRHGAEDEGGESDDDGGQ